MRLRRRKRNPRCDPAPIRNAASTTPDVLRSSAPYDGKPELEISAISVRFQADSALPDRTIARKDLKF